MTTPHDGAEGTVPEPLWNDDHMLRVAKAWADIEHDDWHSAYYALEEMQEQYEKERRQLYAEIAALKRQLTWAESFIPGPWQPGEAIYTRDVEESQAAVEYWKAKGKME